MVEPLILPKSFFVQVEQLACLVSGPTLGLLQRLLQVAMARLEKQVKMIRHDDELKHVPTSPLSIGDGFHDHLGDFRTIKIGDNLGTIEPMFPLGEYATIQSEVFV